MRTHPRSAFRALLAALALGVPALGDVLVVDPGNPQAFDGIQAAVDAAVDGDVVLVKTGNYSTFQILDRSIAVVADAGAAVHVDGAVRVRGLAAARSVVLSGLDVTGVFNSFEVQRHGLYVKNCTGSVRAIDCTFRAATAPNLGCHRADGAYVELSQDVAFERCTFRGRTADFFTGRGLYVGAARVALHDSIVLGGHGGTNPPCAGGYTDGGDGGAGAWFEYSAFGFAQGSHFQGGYGGPGTTFCGGECLYNGSGAGGLTAAFGTNATVAELGSSATGGMAGPCQTCFGLCQLYCGGTDALGFASTVLHVPGTARTLEAPRVVREGQTVTLTITGTPGDRVELAIGPRPAFRVLPGNRGVNLISRRETPYVALLGTVPASGTLVTSWPLPDLGAGVEGGVLHTQAALIDVSGVTTLTGAAAIVLLDAAF